MDSGGGEESQPWPWAYAGRGIQ